jgi:hypothetical protein
MPDLSILISIERNKKMKNMKRIAYLTLLVLSVVFVLNNSALAGWKEKIANNQIKVAEYIMQLKNGASPDNVPRPTLRREDKYKAKIANKELRQAMDEAEQLAREGKNALIKPPSFTRLVSEETYQDLEKKDK